MKEAQRELMDFLEELEARLLAGDGAMGTLLMARGVPADRCFEELCVSEPKIVARVHEDYLAAGARLIRTNTFGANAVRLARHGFERRVSEINWTAAQLARDCARGKGAYVAGSVGPLGITLAEAKGRGLDAVEAFTAQIGALLDGGAQLVFLETFTDLEELALALYVKQSLHHCPAICSLVCTAEGRLFSGLALAEAFQRLRDLGADIVGVNCVQGRELRSAMREVPAQEMLSLFPTAGLPVEGQYPDSPADFARDLLELAGSGACLLGGCCGTTPAHIQALAQALASGAA